METQEAQDARQECHDRQGWVQVTCMVTNTPLCFFDAGVVLAVHMTSDCLESIVVSLGGKVRTRAYNSFTCRSSNQARSQTKLGPELYSLSETAARLRCLMNPQFGLESACRLEDASFLPYMKWS